MSKLIAGITAGIWAARVRNASKHAAMAAIGCATLSLFAASAGAATSLAVPLGAPQKTVDFQDLDLSKAADAKRLYRRLRHAASDVCVGYPESNGSLRHTGRDRCEHAAVTNAVKAIGHPNLTAVHAAKADPKLAQSKSTAASST